MTAPAEIDPFASNTGAPSVSFKDAPVGTVVTLIVTDSPKMVQGLDFKTKLPKFWPAKNGQEPNPVMNAVINGTVDGEERSLWAQKPSSMFIAIQEECKRLGGHKIGPGDSISIKFTGTKPTDGDPQKLYAAKIVPAPPPAPKDVFGNEPAAGAGNKIKGWDDSTPPW